jgi:hypothetical protein
MDPEISRLTVGILTTRMSFTVRSPIAGGHQAIGLSSQVEASSLLVTFAQFALQ